MPRLLLICCSLLAPCFLGLTANVTHAREVISIACQQYSIVAKGIDVVPVYVQLQHGPSSDTVNTAYYATDINGSTANVTVSPTGGSFNLSLGQGVTDHVQVTYTGPDSGLPVVFTATASGVNGGDYEVCQEYLNGFAHGGSLPIVTVGTPTQVTEYTVRVAATSSVALYGANALPLTYSATANGTSLPASQVLPSTETFNIPPLDLKKPTTAVRSVRIFQPIGGGTALSPPIKLHIQNTTYSASLDYYVGHDSPAPAMANVTVGSVSGTLTLMAGPSFRRGGWRVPVSVDSATSAHTLVFYFSAKDKDGTRLECNPSTITMAAGSTYPTYVLVDAAEAKSAITFRAIAVETDTNPPTPIRVNDPVQFGP